MVSAAASDRKALDTDVSRPAVTTLIGGARPWYSLRLREAWQYRDLFVTLGQRDVKLRYRQTFLGVAWVVIQPLLAAGIFSFVFGSVAHLSSGKQSYFVFAFVGLLAWNAFSATVTRTTTSLITNAHLIAKVYFPRVILPASTIVATALDFVVSFVVFLIIAAVQGAPLTLRLLTIPLWLMWAVMLALGIGLVLGAGSVRYRDVAFVTPVAVQMLLYASPVAYSVSVVPKQYQMIYSLNPLVGLLEGFRWATFGTESLTRTAMLSAGIGPVVVLIVGLVSFRKLERRFADVI
jgi:lipopolysaccharide transport system permease protein